MIRAKNTKTFGAAPKAPQYHKRRKQMEGEDLNALKIVMREIEGQHIAVEDFILLIAPHTGDKGAALTKVMADDLNNFRKYCNGAYDTMTKDTNEVMATTQIELGQLYAERVRLLIVNIINCMKAIHDYIPDFNLEEYNMDSEKYLAVKFNISDLPDDTEVDTARRQLAYHRLNWLQSEGDRLSAENNKLQQRLNELKKIQKKEIADQISKEREAETQRIALEQQQAEMQTQLENLVDDLLETIVSEEEKVMGKKRNTAMNSLSKKNIPADSRKSSLKRKNSKWSVKAAQEMEMSNINTASTVKNVSTLSQMKRPASRLRAPRQLARVPESIQTPKVKQKAGPTTRKKRAKKPAAITQRPAWQDVEVNFEEDQAAARGMEQTPIDLFAAGRSGSTCPPTCSSSGGPEATRSRSPAPAPAQYATQTQARPAPRPSSPPRNVGRRAARPQDAWGGFL